jgi:hypothetical protein
MTLLRSLIASMIVVGASAGVAADQPPGPSAAPSKEQREQMAALHEKMAACLRSDQDFAVCRTEMQQNCQAMMGAQGCPMGMHDWMTRPAPPVKPEK